MNIEAAVAIVHDVIRIALTLAGPFLGGAIFVGISVSLAQTITSIQDQTLAFVPKLITLLLLIFVGTHWTLRCLIEFTIATLQHLPEMAQ